MIKVLPGPGGDDPALGIFVKDDRPCEAEIARRAKGSLEVPSSQKESETPE
jgi:hypothetical protein